MRPTHGSILLVSTSLALFACGSGSTPLASTSSELAESIGSCGVQVHVNPFAGNDANPVNALGVPASAPLFSITQAQQVVRRLNGAMTSDICVVLHQGLYPLANTLQLGPQDGGTHGFHVVYMANPGDQVVLSGGIPINGWTANGNGTVVAPTPPGLAFRSFFVNGARATLTRFPHQGNGYLNLLQWQDGPQQLVSSPAAAPSVAAGYNGGDPPGEIVAFLQYDQVRMPLGTVEQADGYTLTHPVTGTYYSGGIPPRYNVAPAYNQFGSSYQQFYLEGAAPFFGVSASPGTGAAGNGDGEWYFSPSRNKVFYQLRKNEQAASLSALAPHLTTLVSIQGQLGNPVQNLVIQGLRFAHTSVDRAPGWNGVQAGIYVNPTTGAWVWSPSAVTIGYASNVALVQSSFTQLGTGGVEIDPGASNIEIGGNWFNDLSGNGITVATLANTVAPNGTSLTPRALNIHDNSLSNVGVDYAANGITVGIASNSTIANNVLTSLPYTGISLGWGWGTPPPAPYGVTTDLANNNVVYNVIGNYMQVYNDGGGIYTRSAQPNTWLRCNYIHDNTGLAAGINARPFIGNMGLYFDGGSSGITAAENYLFTVSEGIDFYGAPPLATNNNVSVTFGGYITEESSIFAAVNATPSFSDANGNDVWVKWSAVLPTQCSDGTLLGPAATYEAAFAALGAPIVASVVPSSELGTPVTTTPAPTTTAAPAPAPSTPPPAPPLPAGVFFVNGGGYYSNGTGQYCSYGSWAQYVASGGPLTGAPTYPTIPSSMVDGGQCALPCGVLLSGSSLHAGQSLVSCDGRFTLNMQADGNLVLDQGSTVLWYPGDPPSPSNPTTYNNPGAAAFMQLDGNLVIYPATNGAAALWSSGSSGTSSFLSMQDDGNLVIYSGTRQPLWSSGTCCH